MSEEEIIEIVENIKNHQIAIFEPKENIQVIRNYFTKEQREVIEGLINLYKQEKEKNKELEEKLKIAKQLYNDACVCIATDCVEKDKIKELLENEIIDISGFRYIAVEDIENLLEV